MSLSLSFLLALCLLLLLTAGAPTRTAAEGHHRHRGNSDEYSHSPSHSEHDEHSQATDSHGHDAAPVSVHPNSLNDWERTAQRAAKQIESFKRPLTVLTERLTAIGRAINEEKSRLDMLAQRFEASHSDHHIEALIDAARQQIDYFASSIRATGDQICSLDMVIWRAEQRIFEVLAIIDAWNCSEHGHVSKGCDDSQRQRQLWAERIVRLLGEIDELVESLKFGVPNVARTVALLEAELKQHKCAMDTWLKEIRKALDAAKASHNHGTNDKGEKIKG